jgi:hypothetical protein
MAEMGWKKKEIKTGRRGVLCKFIRKHQPRAEATIISQSDVSYSVRQTQLARCSEGSVSMLFHV